MEDESQMLEEETWLELRQLLESRLSPADASIVRRGLDFRDLGMDSVLLFEILDIVEEYVGIPIPNDVAAAMASFDDLVSAVVSIRN